MYVFAMASKKKSGTRSHRFGGDWTSAKLDILAKYLASYTTALKGTHLKKAYIDAFAGTGYRTASTNEDGELFPDLAAAAPQSLLDGSARLALKVSPRFDSYVFIERSPTRCEGLELLKNEFPELANNVRIVQGEANREIQALCAKDWTRHRAVLLLDPYGMQVEWQTLEAIAATRAIDLWLLFPLGIGVNRLLTRSGEIPASWRNRLDLLLGTTDWYDEFYKVESAPTLFSVAEERVVKSSVETIGRYFNMRLRTIFSGVADEPAVLRNSANCPLYLFCFAASNAKGAPIALKIANHLLKGIR